MCDECGMPDDFCHCYNDDEWVNPEPEGCVFGKDCVNPHPDHESSECATAEMMEAYGG